MKSLFKKKKFKLLFFIYYIYLKKHFSWIHKKIFLYKFEKKNLNSYLFK